MSDSKLKTRKIKKVLGTGDSKKPSQKFKLPQGYSPSSLQILVKNSPWKRVDSFTKSGPTDQVYFLSVDEGEIQFGDGKNGARPPTGATIRATYNYGGGEEGNIGVGKAKKPPQSKLKVKRPAKLK